MKQTKRVSIKSLQQLSNTEFLDLFCNRKIISKNDSVTLKVCGIGFRFGKLEDGTFFVEGSRTGIITNPNDFIDYAIEKDYIGLLFQRCVAYSDIFHLLKNQQFVKDLPNNTKIVCEFLYNPLHIEETNKTIQFVNYHYDKDKLGTLCSIVPLDVFGDYDINKLYYYSTSEILFINPRLYHRYDIDISYLTERLNNIDKNILKSRKIVDKIQKKIYNDIIDNTKNELNDLLYREFSYEGILLLGQNIEGFVIQIDNTKLKIKYE